MAKLGRHESMLSGRWLETDEGPTPEDDCKRIAALTRNHLKASGTDLSRWSTLYRDPDDGRLWELTFANSDLPGGGPPTLRVLAPEDAAARFGHKNLGANRS